MRGVACGNVGSACKACANAEEHSVKTAFLHFGGQIGHLAGELELHAKLGDARDLLVKDFAGQTVLRNAVAHHAACGLGAVAHADLMTHAGEMVGGGKACRTCAHDKNALAALRLGLLKRPTVFKRMVAEEAFDGVDTDGLVELAAIAGGLTRVVAHAAHAGGEGIVLDDLLPGMTVVAAFSMVEPRLALLAGGTLGIARREAVHIDRTQRAPASGAVGQRRADIERNGKGFAAHRYLLIFSIKSDEHAHHPEPPSDAFRPRPRRSSRSP